MDGIVISAGVEEKPAWLKKCMPGLLKNSSNSRTIAGSGLNTVCESARCPNIGECWNRGAAAFLLLGDVCTRSCGFCGVRRGVPESSDDRELDSVVVAARTLGLTHVVLTSVTRDDLHDGGAAHWAAAIARVREGISGVTVEALYPDFSGNETSWRIVADAAPDIFAHNMETTAELYRTVRAGADYAVSLRMLEFASSRGLRTKSGFMLGLGEEDAQIRALLRDLRSAGVSMLTIGQYLRPGRSNLPIVRYAAPDEFSAWKDDAEALGFSNVESGPLVRSSYHAQRQAASR